MLRLFSSIIIIISVAKFAHSGNHLKCGKNEILSKCENRICEYRKCSDVGQPIECEMVDRKNCIKGCICRDNYLRAYNGTCIPVDQCPPNCGKNEIPTSCIEEINERRNCSDLSEPVYCVQVDQQFCTDGCLCEDGYLRDSYGMCIPINECPEAQCGDNQKFDLCPATCPGEECGVDPSLENCSPSPEPGSPSCQPSCRCCDGYLRNQDGCCIPEDECPLICGDNEIPTACIQLMCERRNCSDIPEPVACVRVDPSVCTDGCLCADGYLRAENGTCIPMDKCPEAQCRDNEIFDSCPAMCPGEECGVDPSVVNCLPSPEPGSPSCQPSCRCCDGYRRNEYGCCIPKDECPTICGENEQPTTCIQAICERRNCSDIPEPVVCVRVNTDFCTDGCLCVDGYLKADNGTCIPMDQCPEAQCGDNEIFDSCPAMCPGEECGVDPSLENCSPSPEPGSPSCQPSCRCCDGYLRNEDGCCIPEEECPPLIICGPDEEYNSCVNGNYCGRRNCSQPGIICIDLIDGGCIEGCLCKEGLLRTDNGSCIPEDQCPPNCYGENEVVGCQRTCPPQTCESIGRKYKCLAQTEECIQECRCIPGYYRNAIGECVSKADCLKCPGPNEYFSCGRACDNVCATLATQNQTNCPIDNIVCNPMCYCVEGYARDSNNTCIPISKCPPPQSPNEVECGPNAVYDSNCTETCPECPPQDCDICLQVLCEPIQDPPGCRCVDNYLRNRKGECVPSEQCETIPKRRPSKRRNQKIVSSVRG